MTVKKDSKDSLESASAFNLEDVLLSKELAPQLSHEGNDHLAGRKGIPVPTHEDLATPEAAQSWAEREVIRATPRAVQEMINQLRYGNMKERAWASAQILDRGGLKTDNKVTNIAPVIVLTSEALQNIPWAKKAVVEGSVVKNVTEGEKQPSLPSHITVEADND